MPDKLDQTIDSLRQVLCRTSTSPMQSCGIRHHLARYLLARYELRHARGDLEEARSLLWSVTESLPKNSAARLQVLLEINATGASCSDTREAVEIGLRVNDASATVVTPDFVRRHAELFLMGARGIPKIVEAVRQEEQDGALAKPKDGSSSTALPLNPNRVARDELWKLAVECRDGRIEGLFDWMGSVPQFLDQESREVAAEFCRLYGAEALSDLGHDRYIPTAVLHSHRDFADSFIRIAPAPHISIAHRLALLMDVGSECIAELVATDPTSVAKQESWERQHSRALLAGLSAYDERLRTFYAERLDATPDELFANKKQAPRPPLKVKPTFPPDVISQKNHLTRVWRTVQVWFLIAHEYAHYLLGHLDGVRRIAVPDLVAPPSYTRKMMREVAADQLAHQVTLGLLTARLDEEDRASTMRNLGAIGLHIAFWLLEFAATVGGSLAPERSEGSIRRSWWCASVEAWMSQRAQTRWMRARVDTLMRNAHEEYGRAS